jgi:hypothetical protein
MARITINRAANNTRIRIAGRLTAADMRRLENACAAALVVHPLRLRIDVGNVTEIDVTAAAVLDKLSARGADIQPNFAEMTCGNSGAFAADFPCLPERGATRRRVR